jgi:hypothetical protein
MCEISRIHPANGGEFTARAVGCGPRPAARWGVMAAVT